MILDAQDGGSTIEVTLDEPTTQESAAVVLQPSEEAQCCHPGGDVWSTVSSVSAMFATAAAFAAIWQAGRLHKAAREDQDTCRSSDLYKQHVLDPLTLELKSFLDRAFDLFADARSKVDTLDGDSTVNALNGIQREASDRFTKEASAAWRRIVLHLDSWDTPSLGPEIRRLWEELDDAVCNEFDKLNLPTDEMGAHVLSGITAILRAVLHHDPARPSKCA